MRLRTLVCLLGCSMLLAAGPAGADFSIDAVSPDVPAVGEGDVLAAGPPPGPPPVVVLTAAAGFGLLPGEELNAFSNGVDTICPAGNPNCFTIITYSVDRAAVGAGPPVTTEVLGNGAAGDIFRFRVTGTGVVLTPPSLAVDAPANDLTIPPPAESNLDALTTSRGIGPPRYFSIDIPAVVTASPRWAMPGLSAADILLGPGPVPTVYATAGALGLLAADDIDGMAISDGPPLGVLDPGDIVYVSLAPGSPSLPGIPAGPGDILQVSPGPPTVIYPAALMALAGADNLDALSMLDPPLPVPSLGGWGVGLLSLTLGGVALWRLRRVAARG